jgi:FkbM family methyltransferase
MTSSSGHFALAGASPSPVLLELLEFGAALRATPNLAQELARITIRDLRAQFPAGQPSVRTVACASGLKLKLDVSDSFAATIHVGFLQENDDFAALIGLIQEGDTVIDIGANFGLYATHAAQRAGASGVVHAYEPAREAFEFLRANAEDNALTQLHVYPTAAGAAARQAEFYVADDLAFSGLRDTGRSSNRRVDTIQIVRLDDEPHLAAPATVDVFKIDVEGGEADVLTGAQALLARSPRAIVQFEYSHKNLTPELHAALDAVVRRLCAAGFNLYARGNDGAGVQLANVPALAEEYSGNLFLARAGEAEARLRAALDASRVSTPPGHAAVEALLRHIEEQGEELKTHRALVNAIGKVAASIEIEADESSPATTVGNLQVSWFELRAERDRAAAAAAHGETQAEAMNAHLAALNAKLEGHKGANERLVQSIGNLNQKLGASQETVAAFKQKLEATEAELKKLRDGVAVLRHRTQYAPWLLPETLRG